MTDFSKLNDRIVRQAFDASKIILSEAQKQKLFQNKIDRAQDMLTGRDIVKSLDQHNRVVQVNLFKVVVDRKRGPALHYKQMQTGGLPDEIQAVTGKYKWQHSKAHSNQ